MKKNRNLTKFILSLSILFSFTNLAEAAENKAALKSIYENILQKDAKQAVESCKALHKKADALFAKAPVDNSQILPDFTNLIKDWKRVQTLYIADELNGDAIDIPFYIDIFHTTNENIYEQIARAVKSNSKPEAALFKNSYRTINALEAVLFQEQKISKRRLEMAKIQLDNICANLTDIEKVYADEKAKFLSLKDNKATALLINVVAKTSFMLKDWRLGDPAGLTRKYEGKPSADRAEYPLSKISMQAIAAILEANNQLIGKQKYDNFIQLMQSHNSKAAKVLQTSQKYLNKALEETKANSSTDFNFAPNKTKPIYDTVGDLHNSYYLTLMQSLPVVIKILEADGD